MEWQVPLSYSEQAWCISPLDIDSSSMPPSPPFIHNAAKPSHIKCPAKWPYSPYFVPCLLGLKDEPQIFNSVLISIHWNIGPLRIIEILKIVNFLCSRKHDELISVSIDPGHLSLRCIIDIIVGICFPLDRLWIKTRSHISPEWYLDFKGNSWAFR